LCLATLESTARTVPNSAAVVVPGGGEFSNIESPGAFNRAHSQFLDAR
jgi:pimeloyl-ACP methyl ester carboxylesterase